MSTNASLTVKDENGKTIINLYKHWDGDVFGKELKDFIKDGKIVDGIGGDADSKTYNGMGCFAAALVAHFKNGIGDVYLRAENQNEQYNYIISEKNGKPVLETF